MNKRACIFALLLMWTLSALAQNIGYIETTRSWYYIYNQDGKRTKSISTTLGELKGYSATFFILKRGQSYYITYDAEGKQIYSFSANIVGEIIGVAGDTFISRLGSWIYTWSKDGKRLGSRSARTL